MGPVRRGAAANGIGRVPASRHNVVHLRRLGEIAALSAACSSAPPSPLLGDASSLCPDRPRHHAGRPQEAHRTAWPRRMRYGCEELYVSVCLGNRPLRRQSPSGAAAAMSTSPTSDRGAFAELLVRHRKAARMTQVELAARANVSVRGISDLERGIIRHPQRATARLLVEALGLQGAEADAFLDTASD